MTISALIKKYWLFAGSVLLCAVIAYAAFVAPSRIGQLELEREARLASEHIGAGLKSEPSTLIDAFRRPALAPQISRIFQDLGYGHRVLRYELYDKTGKLTFTSGKAGLELEKPVLSVPEVSPGADANVALHNRSDTAVFHVSVLTIPVHTAEQPDATLLVYLDQSERANVLSCYFGLVTAITMLLLGAGVATPIALTWMRSQERQQAEERLRYLQNHDPLTGLPNREAFSEILTNAMANMQRKGSRRSTTRRTSPPATPCCAPWGAASRARFAAATSSPGARAMSSPLPLSA
jgi:hypothetical protein